ncbi:MAG: dTDP-4-amino-4,6-dideoxygalactose transaminase, partial [Candidatus Azotimanducaceae bacterium]
YRMTEVQAALGISQMDRLSDFVCQRNSLARRYDELLAHLPLVTPWHHPDGYSARHLYIIRLDLEHTKKTHREIFLALREGGVGVNLHYIPVHIQPWYTKMGFLPDDFPNAMAYYSEAISIPLYATLDECGQDQVVSVLSKVLAA